ncbi:MAG: hypothetical protein EOM25_15000, partial [Deltaproteobacteria bacterium]|nr:hypothetical protein [Deltaproteobacteria bacterium]
MSDEKKRHIQQFEADPLEVVPDQDVRVDRFQPGDELGVARLYHVVYGDAYPVEDYYIPERILALNREMQLCSVVCKTTDGSIVGHGALYRSTPPFAGVYEVGQYLVLKSHRQRGIADLINRYVYGTLASLVPVETIFGEAVTNHVVTQRFDLDEGMTDYALELSLLPAGKGRDGATGRVACLVQAKTVRDRPHTVHLPSCYQEVLDFLLADRDFERTCLPAQGSLPQDRATSCQTQSFRGTGTARLLVSSLGNDFPGLMKRLEDEFRAQGCVTFQAFLNLGEEGVGAAVDLLRNRGWFLGGYLPRWFDTDGLLMQKILEPPDFESMRLAFDKARKLA